MPSNGETRKPRPGSLLVASPRLLDPNFMHTVVLLCDHGPAGTFGLVLNRPMGVTVGSLDAELDLLRDREDPLWSGGPVTPTEVHVLHAEGAEIPGTVAVAEGIFLGGDPDVLHSSLTKGGGSARFFAGYSGWGPGQLDEEMEDTSWIVCPATPDVVFDPRPDTLWRRVLRAQGGAVAALADVPPDPSWN